MKKSLKVQIKKKGIVTLTEKDYKAEGGEGVVYCKGKTAFKIYHDPKKMIPVAKIKELQQIKRDNILAPQNIIYDTRNSPIGFTMRYIDGLEYLCKLFVKNFKDKNGIGIQDIVEIISELQRTLVDVHKQELIVGDYNEMNFLIDKSFKTPYHIDVDSWQTKNFKATAIMETVRDRKVPLGTFNEMTDWFAFSIITFQLYTGVHPFKGGRHPKYKASEWSKRMDDGVSVFDKGAKLPPFIKDFSFIPQKHLDWFKGIFIKNDRSIPPFADGTMVAVQQFVNVVGNDHFIINLVHEYDGTIKSIYNFSSGQHIITRKAIFKSTDEVFKFKDDIKNRRIELADVFNEKPLIAIIKNDECHFLDFDRQEYGKILAENFMEYNGAIYTIHNGQMIENTFEKFGKIIHKTKNASNIYEAAYKVFKGVVVQDIMGKCWMALPYKIGFCRNVHLPELDHLRIIDVLHNNRICVVMAEKKNKYFRFTIAFNEDYSSYTINQEDDVDFNMINFTTLPNGVCCMLDNQNMYLFKNNTGRKEVSNPPIDISMRLYNDNMIVLFTDEKKLYSVALKK